MLVALEVAIVFKISFTILLQSLEIAIYKTDSVALLYCRCALLDTLEELQDFFVVGTKTKAGPGPHELLLQNLTLLAGQ